MPILPAKFSAFRMTPYIAIAFAVVLSACAQAPSDVSRSGIFDPYERQNRKVHRFNRNLDKALVKPASTVYGTILPTEIQDSVAHFSENLSLPGQVINNVLQGDVAGAGNNTARFLVNTVLGIGGMFDVASDFGMPIEKTGFGETLHVWGAKEGAYTELPFFGPSTQRDTAGIIVDIVLDPVALALPRPEKYITTGAYVAARFGQRHKYTATVDSILYESADSYAQARTLYLQNRRYELSGKDDETDLEAYDDPYDDF